MSAEVRSITVSKAMAQQKAKELVRQHEAQVMLLRGEPRWSHGDLTVKTSRGQERVAVRPAVSPLAALDIITRLQPEERVIILTNQPESELGDTVTLRAYQQQLITPDEWQAVPHLFGAGEVSRDLRRHDWAATALLDHQPAAGWPQAGENALTARRALSALVARLMGLDPSVPWDSTSLLLELSSPLGQGAWSAAPADLRHQLSAWAAEEYGPVAGLTLKLAGQHEHFRPLALGLAADALWPAQGSYSDDDRIRAQVRFEDRFLPTAARGEDKVRAFADAARGIALRAPTDSAVRTAVEQGEKLLQEFGWPAGADHSLIFAAGLKTRIHRFAAALRTETGVEEAYGEVLEHLLARHAEHVEDAVRVYRWLQTPEIPTGSLAEDLNRQMTDGAWVDAAVGRLRGATDDAVMAAAYDRLIEQVRTRRTERDYVAAKRLDQVAGTGDRAELGTSALGVERLLEDVVRPWISRRSGVLLVVLDGLSAAVAADLAHEAAGSRYMEHVPENTGHRLGAVAALPSLTRISRTSLFSGSITEGGQNEEKRGLRSVVRGAQVFHKADLSDISAAALPEPVSAAISDQRIGVVGAVINTLDEALHKTDASARARWTLDSFPQLKALLDAAITSRRTVVITSDHGHVLDYGTEALSAEEAEPRWRLPTPPEHPGEVLVRGPRVAVPGEEAILLWREDLRYGRSSAGYHGGASLAELTIPVVVLQPAHLTEKVPQGWMPAPPQSPWWWREQVRAQESKPTEQVSKPTKKAPSAPENLSPLFEVEAPEEAQHTETGSLVEQLLASDVFAEQLERAGRRRPDSAQLKSVLQVLLDRGGRAHRDTVAAAVGIPPADVRTLLAALRRLVNLDGYEILGTDPADPSMVRLNETLLREQFDLKESK